MRELLNLNFITFYGSRRVPYTHILIGKQVLLFYSLTFFGIAMLHLNKVKFQQLGKCPRTITISAHEASENLLSSEQGSHKRCRSS